MPGFLDSLSLVLSFTCLVSGYIIGNFLADENRRWGPIIAWTIASILSAGFVIFLRTMPVYQGVMGFGLVVVFSAALGWFEGKWTRRIKRS